ncbi:MAG: polyphosphate kinase [Chloroflexi bacterium HGW-Chloroflexi-10]|nr:MAG: polyphosphate kinase [Chloroflexi bacterium HGW-Chloroflexi-10]
MKYKIKQGDKVDLNKWDPNEISEWSGDKKKAKEKLLELNKKLEQLQELLYAQHKHKILIILQAMDTGGKDGVVRAVFEGVNPSGVRVASFKVPTQDEIDHDYLWRIHKYTPGSGEIVIFNRSHYEDVLVVRVHQLVSKDVWEKRYEHINAFEKMLTDEGTLILKFFLHISNEEQKERLLERQTIPEKQWKFSNGDLNERKLWSEYQAAYEDALQKTSTDCSPWYVIPSNRNWYRNLMIATILVKALESLKMEYPKPIDGIEKIVIQ